MDRGPGAVPALRLGSGARTMGEAEPLRLELVRSHDLPPAWDGEPVTWGDWSEGRTSLSFHAPAESLACDKCGAIDEPAINRGMRAPVLGSTFRVDRERVTRSGRRYVSGTVDVPAWACRDLRVARCRHCGHDVVTDERTGEAWDLEPDDYLPGGSYPDGLLF